MTSKISFIGVFALKKDDHLQKTYLVTFYSQTVEWMKHTFHISPKEPDMSKNDFILLSCFSELSQKPKPHILPTFYLIMAYRSIYVDG